MSTPRRRATVALVAWTLLVWTTRIGNIWRDHALTHAEKWGRTGLALSFTALAALVAVSLWKRLDWQSIAVKGLAGWTIGVWITRSVGIATGDHPGAFIAVHLVLAVISIALSVLAVREDAASGRVAGAVPASGAAVPDH
jgi:cobalamin synthase